VGAYKDAMQHLENSGLKDAILDFANSKKPLLGICLGMQLLFESSEEFGYTKGLGLIEGKVVKFDKSKMSSDLKIPHMGWNKTVNKDNPLDTQIYIAEAGARVKGDIEEITMFLEPDICVIGSVGEQHIEYFKTLDNIIHTKMEILKSPKMKMGFVHESVPIKPYPAITK
ncbi:Mur ligase family protein, partial [Halarcobacter bivalviorum]|uniref:Mur ligase family protein n=1 Tax=Halarcobacter bivalviorum TaxID=663364 RepID=UPI002265CE36